METEAAMETVQEGFTPLYIAAQEGHAASTKQLIEARKRDENNEAGSNIHTLSLCLSADAKRAVDEAGAKKKSAGVDDIWVYFSRFCKIERLVCYLCEGTKDSGMATHVRTLDSNFRHIDGRPGDNLSIPYLVTKHMVSGGNRVSCSKDASDEYLVILIV